MPGKCHLSLGKVTTCFLVVPFILYVAFLTRAWHVLSPSTVPEEIPVPSESASTILVHIPKTGGSMVSGHSYKELIARIRREGHTSHVQCSSWHIPPEWFVPSGGPYRAYTTFTVIRNPYDRVISNYKWGCWAQTHVFEFYLGVKTHKLSGMGVERCKRNVTLLNEFSQFMISKTASRETADHYGADCHYVPQSVYVTGVDHVFCNITVLKGFLLQHGRDSQMVNQLRDLGLYNRSELSESTQKLIQSVYEADFDLMTKCESGDQQKMNIRHQRQW